MAQHDHPAPGELVTFYKSRFDSFNEERESFLELLQRCSVDRGQVYALEQSVSKCTEQVQQLQKALSDSQVKLFDTREKLLQLQAERDALLLHAEEDKARVQNLLAFTQPVLHNIHHAKDKQPAGAVTYSPLLTTRNFGSPEGPASNKGLDSAGTLRTVFLPNEEAQLLTRKLTAVQAQLAEQHDFSQERITALLNDRQQREEASSARTEKLTRQVEELQSKLEQREALLEKTTRELLLSRHEQQVAQRNFQEQAAEQASTTQQAQRESARSSSQLELALQLLPGRCGAALRALGAALDRAQVGGDAPYAQAKKDTERLEDPEVASCREAALVAASEHASGTERRLREQVAALEHEVKQGRTAHQAVTQQHQDRIRHLERRLRECRARRRELEVRRALDVEGFAHELVLAKKQVASIERQVQALSWDASPADTDPLTLVQQLAVVRDELDRVAAKILQRSRDDGD